MRAWRRNCCIPWFATISTASRKRQSTFRGASGASCSSVEAHLARRLGPAPTDGEVLDALALLGPPERLRGDQREPSSPARLGALEWAAISLVLLGGFLGGVGWLVGVFCLWFSNAWKWYDKVIAMLLWPFGLAMSTMWVAGWLVSADSTSAGGVLDVIRTLAIFGVPLMTSAYLIRRARVHV